MILPFKKAVKEIVGWVYADTNVTLDRANVAAAYIEDLATIGNRGLTAEECELLILGDEDGEIPADLVARFPKLHAFLDSQLT